jgi:hypothetical protein
LKEKVTKKNFKLVTGRDIFALFPLDDETARFLGDEKATKRNFKLVTGRDIFALFPLGGGTARFLGDGYEDSGGHRGGGPV